MRRRENCALMSRFENSARTLAAACVLLAAAGCAASGGKPASPAPGSDQTRTIFERNCAVCHGPQGEGKQLGTMTIPSLRAGAALTDPDEKLFRQIRDGGNGMPPSKYTLTDEQIQDLVRFVREEIQKK
jgi:mono/diheme cytochrome c family protein